ncbi:MAG: transporter ATP-binding protein [Cytophagaceae bacterium]|jgi:ABC-2 type transport system ATP-binding protein|nr:transporter ATP-binding protein [Cytophagaceae bacterium]
MVEIQDLTYAYKKKAVFNGLTITFEAGNIYGLLGKNGTGKSTLFKNICGLLKPGKGEVKVAGQASKLRDPDMLSKIFMLPEDFFVPPVKIKDFTATLAPFYPNFSYTDFDQYILEFDIPTQSRLDQMSMGQKKKALIAFSLATNTELLLMDEPTNGLDIVSKSQFKKVMSGAIAANKCIIISTHQVKDIENLVDRISVIDNGSILFNASIAEVGKKLIFQHTLQASPKEKVVYAEETLTGISEVLYNTSGEESKVDLEALYKSIMINPSVINNLFNA